MQSIYSGLKSLVVGEEKQVVQQQEENDGEDSDYGDADEGEVVCETKGTISLITDGGKKVPKGRGVVASLVRTDDFAYSLVIKTAGGTLLMQQTVSSDLCMIIHATEFQWISYHNTKLKQWSLEPDDLASLKLFTSQYAAADWETTHQMSFSKIFKKQDDKDYLTNTYHDDLDYKHRDDYDDDEGSDIEFDNEPERMQMPEEAWDYSKRGAVPDAPLSLGNLNVGIAEDLSFACKGSQIGVMQTSENNKLINVIEDIRTAGDGESFIPFKTMLNNRDTTMLMIHPDDERKHSVQVMNLERGTVVEEWSAGEGQMIRSFAPSEKYGQRTGEKTFVGVSNNAIFTMDPRVNTAQKAVNIKTYAKTPFFSCMATNAAGQIAVGTTKGEIKLYNDTGKQAKTNLPGLGDPVIGIDVTENGHWVLATTPRYLMMVSTIVDGRDKSGFMQSMGQAKPTPIKLKLNHSDIVRYQITKLQFTPAHFNIGENIKEQFVVSSTGAYIVMWNLAKVLRKDPKPYTIRDTKCAVAENPLFRFNRPKDIVVITGDQVYNERVVRGCK